MTENQDGGYGFVIVIVREKLSNGKINDLGPIVQLEGVCRVRHWSQRLWIQYYKNNVVVRQQGPYIIAPENRLTFRPGSRYATIRHYLRTYEPKTRVIFATGEDRWDYVLKERHRP